MIETFIRIVLVGCMTATAMSAASAQDRSRPAPVEKKQDAGGADRQVLRGIRLKLRDGGYGNITFSQRSAPYKVQACRDGELLSMTVAENGDVQNSETIGICGRSERFGAQSDVRRQLRDKGYRSIEVLTEGPQRTVFTGCKSGILTRIVVSRRGDIRREVETRRRCGNSRPEGERSAARSNQRPLDRPIGRPAERGQPTNRLVPAASSDVARIFLEHRRYSDVRILESDNDLVVAEACRGIRRFTINIDVQGRRIIKRRRNGWCEAPRSRPIARASRPDFDLETDNKIDADRCQDAFDYLLDQEKVYFETASAEVGRDSLPLLRRLARIAKRCPSSTIVIGGHTDSVGSDESNQKLSEKRAFSVAVFLRNQGIPQERLGAIGYGERRPVASNDTEEGRALNRRIEMLVEWEE